MVRFVAVGFFLSFRRVFGFGWTRGAAGRSGGYDNGPAHQRRGVDCSGRDLFFPMVERLYHILKGGIPIMLIMGGILAIYVGLDAIQDRAREEQHKQEEKMHKTQGEIEQVKAQAEQYRKEIEKLKEQTKQNHPQQNIP